MKRTWSGIAIVVLTAVIVVVAVDVLTARISPPVNRREAEDGFRDLAHSNPDVLVLGSSHARTLHVLGQELAARTNQQRSLVAVPLENGKIVVYDWALQHRLAPLIEEKNSDGTLVRDKLRQFLLIIEWWDSCAPNERERYAYWNLPSRAWHAEDFVADVAQSGLTGYNRNYLQNRIRRWFAHSALLFDRINQKLVARTMDLLHGRSLERSPEAEQEKIVGWQHEVEKGVSCIGNDEQMAALHNVISYVKGRGLKMTIMLFPRKPNTLTAKAKGTTLAQFADLVHGIGKTEGVEVIDLTTTSPLVDDDFMEDFDHVNQEGNAKFARWALDHPLRFLAEPQTYASASAREVSP